MVLFRGTWYPQVLPRQDRDGDSLSFDRWPLWYRSAGGSLHFGGQVDAYNALFMAQRALVTGQAQQQTVVVNVGTPTSQAPASSVEAPASAPKEEPQAPQPELPSDVAEKKH